MSRLIGLLAALTALAAAPFLYKGMSPTVSGGSTQIGSCQALFLGGKAPTVPDKQLVSSRQLCSTRYAVLHSGLTRTPLWSAEDIVGTDARRASRVERSSQFEPDNRLPGDERAELADYRRSGYDRGHLTPSGDMPDLDSQAETFKLSNIVPQNGKLNRGPWAELEKKVRRLAIQHQQAFIVTGVLFEGSTVETTGTGRVSIPTSMWKAIAIPGDGAAVVIATNTDDPRWETLSVDSFTKRTGIDPFPGLSASTRSYTLNIRNAE